MTAETRISHSVPRVSAAPVAAPRSLSRQVRDSLHKDVTGETVVPTICFDFNSALKTIYSGFSSLKTKHINIRYQISRNRQECGIVNFSNISTNDNLTDIMTKALGPEKHPHFATGIGLHSKI